MYASVQKGTIVVMRMTVSEARRTLPELVKRVKGGDLRIQITVHGEVAAELRAAVADPPPGAAAARLRELMTELPLVRGGKRRTSEEVVKHLYGDESR